MKKYTKRMCRACREIFEPSHGNDIYCQFHKSMGYAKRKLIVEAGKGASGTR